MSTPEPDVETEWARVGLQLVGGPTVLLTYAGLRLLTDPTFDAHGGRYVTGPVVLDKTHGPAVDASAIGPLDAVLLSHDEHADNLDAIGRALLAQAGRTLTTPEAAVRLGGNADGLAPFESVTLSGPEVAVRVTATPAQHGPDGTEHLTGTVRGFVLEAVGHPTLYVSGDNTSQAYVGQVAERFSVDIALLHLGAASLDVFPGHHVSMTAEDAVRAAHVLGARTIVPVHLDSWQHYTEDVTRVQAAFDAAGLGARLAPLAPGRAVSL